MATLIAVHKIVTSPHGAELVHTGAYDAAGNAIVRKVLLTTNPGEFFDYEGSDLVQLLDMGAVRYPTENEITLREAGIPLPTAVRPAMQERVQ